MTGSVTGSSSGVVRSLVVRGGLDPGPGTARDWLRRELAGQEYRPSLRDRVLGWLHSAFDDLQSAASGFGGFSPLVAVLVLLVLAGLLAFLLTRLRGNPTASAPPAVVFGESRRTAGEHRSAARRALERGEWDEAVLESVRALAAGLFERDLVVEEPGVTSHEMAAAAGQRFPALADALADVANTFDETRYGDRRADEHAARTAYSLQEQVAGATPESAGRASPALARPR